MTNIEIAEALAKLIRPKGNITCGEAQDWLGRLVRAGFPHSIADYATWPGPTERARLESEP